MKDSYSILALCANLRVSPSGFYDWQKRQNSPGPRAREDETLAQEIQQIHQRSRQTYGSPRIVDELRKNGKRHGRNRVGRLMNERACADVRRAATASKPPTATMGRAHRSQSPGHGAHAHRAQPDLGG